MEWLARGFAWLVRAALGLCALMLVLAAVYVSLGRELVPLVAEYRLEAEDRAREALGMPVQIGALEGLWQGFAPLLTAHDMVVGEGAGALQLDQVRVVPDVLGSLLARQLRIARLELDGVQLVVQQAEDGGWSLKGMPQRPGAAPLDLAEVLKQSHVVKRLSLLNSQVTLQALGQPERTLTYVNLTLRNGLARQRLDGRLLLPDGQPLALQVRTRLRAERWQDAQADVYLSLPQSDWAAWLPANLLAQWRLEQLRLGGEVWLAWANGGVQRVVSRLHAPQIKAGYADRESIVLDNVVVNAYFSRAEQGFTLQLDDLAFSRSDKRWGEVRLALTQQAESAELQEQWLLSADRLDLAPLQPLVAALAPLPENALAVLAQLNPHGALRNIQLDYRPRLTDSKRLQFAANLERIGFAAYLGSPAVENVSGSISGDLGQGELRLDSDDFSLHLDTLFPQPWRYKTANARLTWRLDEQAFTLRSPYLQVVGDEGPVAGDFLIRLRRDPAGEDYMDLRVGLRNGDARFTEKYLPSRSPGMSHDLDAWLKAAIRGGAVDEGYFQYQGSLNKGAEAASRTISLFFAVHDAELAFQPGWPALREGRGRVLIEDSGVRVELAQGRILDSQVRNAQAVIATALPGQSPRLLLEAELDSSVVDALQILQQAPIGTAPTFAGWRGEGVLAGKLKLDLPLRKGAPPAVVVDFATADAQLSLPNPPLQFTQLQGAFRYNTASGLSAPDIRAQVLGHAVHGKALAEGARGKARSRFEASGQIAVKELTNWLGVTQPVPVGGKVPYRLNLILDGVDSQLRVTSSLKGTSIALPAPLGKDREEVRTAAWQMSLGGREQRFWLDYAELLSLSFAAEPGKLGLGRGELRLADGPASLPTSQGLRVRGRVTELDWSAWQQALQPYAQVPKQDAQQLFKDAQLRIGNFSGFGINLEALEVGVRREAASWAVSLDSPLLKGTVGLPEDSAQAITVQLDYLRFPAAEPKIADAPDVEKPDPLGGFDPAGFPALDVRVAQVFQGIEPLGAWSFKARPVTGGVHFNELDLNLKGLNLAGRATWLNTATGARSTYNGRLGGADLADVLIAWGYAPTASSRDFHLDVDGSWPGSPAWFGIKRFSGSLDASLRKGQFSEVEGPASALRVFGLLNFNSIGRRLRLDFSDLLGKGLSYDRVKGVLDARDGVFVTREPITLEGPSSNLELKGTLDMAHDRIDAKLLVTLPVTNNLPLAALIVGAPAIGGALFVADKLLGDRVARFASVQYDVTGPWQNPNISFDKPFEKPQ
ncbi:TIGR02099 family protein [Pseudomonas sp. HMWF032]|uniref:YhdP family protein n=1 Tax=Pseudomonas sp. HMWF032 TaxID=2056866 RepID=UPI000D373D31|nr:YhdP family protein [Pseudomonas sp. HMWF032]PTS85864.1 TIGR02099 family protein [Pseudomonas sp. HMWF032]PTT80610.1 TIGR02099 family protein [Pseudomonas sp. HMWF010]